MKKFITAAVTALLLAQNPLFLFAAESATVKSVRVSAESVYIETDRPVQYKAFTTEKPSRLVLELMDARLKTLQEIPVNGRSLSRVRTGQFQTSPVSISRVVMDLTQKSVYEITRKGTELVVMFGARAAKPSAPAIKDSPASAPAGVKVIAPASASGMPLELTLEPAPVKPADLNSASTPVIAPKKSYPRPTSRNIMDNLSRDPISFDYSEAEVREVIDMLAAKANLNIIYSDDVTGTVTISLAKVPFDEAFKTLLNVKGLAAQQVGDNILRIATPSTFISEQKKGLQQTRVFFLNYSKASEIKAQVDSVAAAEGRSSKSIPDDNNNALIVTDNLAGLDATARLIRDLDRAPKQVLIEAKLVEVSLDSSFDIGVKWSAASGPNWRAAATGVSGTDKKLEVDQTAAGLISGALRFGKLTANSVLDAVITAAASKGKAKVLSDPKVTTLNNKEANINITSQIPYDVCQLSGTGITAIKACNTLYSTVGITLKVTPTLTSDGHISLKVVPNVSQPSAGYKSGSGVAPGIDTRSADTSVIIKDGDTIVIGGLIHDEQRDTVSKVPVLGDIPLLGALFRHKTVTRSRQELLIFVTTRIIVD